MCSFFPRFPMKYYLYWLKWQGWFSSSPSLTYTKQHIHKNLIFKPYSLCNFVSWVSRTIYEQFLLIVCVLHLSLTWSLMYVDNLTTVVYLKQKKLPRDAPHQCVFNLFISACNIHCKNDDEKEQTFIRKRKIKCPLCSKCINKLDRKMISLV